MNTQRPIGHLRGPGPQVMTSVFNLNCHVWILFNLACDLVSSGADLVQASASARTGFATQRRRCHSGGKQPVSCVFNPHAIMFNREGLSVLHRRSM
jgi:hypothetical protein